MLVRLNKTIARFLNNHIYLSTSMNEFVWSGTAIPCYVKSWESGILISLCLRKGILQYVLYRTPLLNTPIIVIKLSISAAGYYFICEK